MAENRVIGRDGALPWRLPKDVQHFKRLTIGHAVIMGRKTFESVGGPLPERRNVVISRNPAYRASGVEVVGSLDAALARSGADEEVFIAGGAEIYRLALPRADRIYLTVVHAQIAGDTYFPELDPAVWHLVDDVRHPANDRHAYPYSFRRYERSRERA